MYFFSDKNELYIMCGTWLTWTLVKWSRILQNAFRQKQNEKFMFQWHEAVIHDLSLYVKKKIFYSTCLHWVVKEPGTGKGFKNNAFFKGFKENTLAVSQFSLFTKC